MNDQSPMPEQAPGQPASKRARIPWGAVIAIVVLCAIVIAVLIPTYADYTDRTQAAEALSELVRAKTPLAEYYANNKKWPQSLADVDVRPERKIVQSLVITKGAGGTGEIEVTATLGSVNVDRRVANKSVRITSTDGGKSWVCRSGTMYEISLPSTCRAPR